MGASGEYGPFRRRRNFMEFVFSGRAPDEIYLAQAPWARSPVTDVTGGGGGRGGANSPSKYYRRMMASRSAPTDT